MHTLRLSSLLSLAVVAIGCGPRPLPERSSPVLEPTGALPVLEGLSALDQRRDGVFAVDTSEAVIVQRLTDGAVTELFRLDDAVSVLVSRADDDVLVGTYDRVFHWDGAQLGDLTPRLEAALILGLAFDGLAVRALDLAADGTVVAAVDVHGQGETAPYGQVCTLSASGDDACEGLGALDGGDANASAVLVEGSRMYVLTSGGERLYVREGGGAFSLVSPDRVVFLHAIEGGRVGYVRDGATSSALHVLGADGQEERRVDGAWFVIGHSAAGFWEYWLDSETDGSCGSFSWSTCGETTLWTQLTVRYVGDERREVAHLDNVYAPIVLPLADGSLRLEIHGQVYELPAP